MNRLRRLWRNGGALYAIQFVFFLAVLVHGIQGDIRAGRWVVSLPLFGGGLLLPYFFRDLLVHNANAVIRTLNAIAICGLVYYVMNRGGPISVQTYYILVACCGLHLGTSFWLMSDPRIGRA